MPAPIPVRPGRFAALIVLDDALEYALPGVLQGSLAESVWSPFRGVTPGPNEFRRALWDQVVAQFGVLDLLSGDVIGIVRCVGLDGLNGWARASWWVDPAALQTPARWEAMWLLIDEVFECFPLRKLYVDVFADEPGFCDLDRIPGVELEGVLRDDRWIGGGWTARMTYGVYRERWSSHADWQVLHTTSLADIGPETPDDVVMSRVLMRADASHLNPRSIALDPLDEISIDAVAFTTSGSDPRRQSGLTASDLRRLVETRSVPGDL